MIRLAAAVLMCAAMLGAEIISAHAATPRLEKVTLPQNALSVSNIKKKTQSAYDRYMVFYLGKIHLCYECNPKEVPVRRYQYYLKAERMGILEIFSHSYKQIWGNHGSEAAPATVTIELKDREVTPIPTYGHGPSSEYVRFRIWTFKVSTISQAVVFYRQHGIFVYVEGTGVMSPTSFLQQLTDDTSLVPHSFKFNCAFMLNGYGFPWLSYRYLENQNQATPLGNFAKLNDFINIK